MPVHLIGFAQVRQSRNFPKFTDHTQKFPKFVPLSDKIPPKMFGVRLNKNPSESDNFGLHLSDLCRKNLNRTCYQTCHLWLRKGSEICWLASEVFRNFSPFWLRTWAKPSAPRLDLRIYASLIDLPWAAQRLLRPCLGWTVQTEHIWWSGWGRPA